MLAVNEVDKFEMVMNTASKAIYEFMKGACYVESL